ncbi:MAG: hypothetical protein P8Z68_03330 [Kineosporiaceae bacterium]
MLPAVPPSVRWFVPVTMTAAILGLSAIADATAERPPQLTSRTPAQLIAGLLASPVDTFSGTVTTHADLGLATLTGLTGTDGTQHGGNGGNGGNGTGDGTGSDTDAEGNGNEGNGNDSGEPPPEGPVDQTDQVDPAVTADDLVQQLAVRVLTEDLTLRMWVDGPDRIRIQVLDLVDETDLVRSGSELWFYSARESLVGHGSLPVPTGHRSPAGQSTGPQAMSPWPLPIPVPQLLAPVLVQLAGPSTALTEGTPVRVAGRPARTLVITPRTSGTLIDRVVVATDADTGFPLRVEVFARGPDDAVLSTEFTSVDLGRPKAERFAFTAPEAARVLPLTLPGTGSEADDRTGTPSATPSGTPSSSPTGTPDGTAETSPDAAGAPKIRLIGTGWTTVLELTDAASLFGAFAGGSGTSDGTGGTTSPNTTPGTSGGSAGCTGTDLDLLGRLTVPAGDGRALRTTLFSILFTADGRVLLGAVPVDALVAAAAREAA